MMRVYLAGGMKSEWRDFVKNSVYYAGWVDPVGSGLINPREYTAWDLNGINASDIVFANLEADNPSGLGIMLEIGYAKALNKFIIFVDQRNDKYTQIGREAASVYFSTLEEGIEFLKTLSDIYL